MGNLCTNRQQKQSQSPLSQTPYTSRRLMNSDLFKSDQYQSKKAIQKIDQELTNFNLISHPSNKYQNDLLLAKNQGDILVLISYIENDELPQSQVNIGHPWAASPKTIGSIATMYMCILFIQDINQGDQGYQNQQNKINDYIKTLKQLKVASILNKNLKHQDIDRIQITILLLVYLVEFQLMQEELINAGIFESCLPYIYINSTNDFQQRIAIAFIIRELYKDRQKYVNIILNDKLAIQTLQDFIVQKNAQYVIEGILYLKQGLDSCDDLTVDSNCEKNVNKITCKLLYEAGFYTSLQRSLNYFNQQDISNYNQDQKEIYSLILELLKCLMTKLLNAYKGQ